MSEFMSTAPLEEGDDIAIATAVDVEGAYNGEQPGDVVAIAVPAGKGLVFEAWLRRQVLGGSDAA